jgi:hypothetical protein
MGIGENDPTGNVHLPQFLTTAQAATFLGLKPQTLREWRCSGSGPAYHRLSAGLKGRCLYDLEDLVAFVRARRFHSTTEETVAAQAGA